MARKRGEERSEEMQFGVGEVSESAESERKEEAFAWGRLKGALVRKYPELKQWLEEREKAAGGFKNLVEELLYTAYLRERFGIRGMTLHDVMQALQVAGEIIDRARDVVERLKGLSYVLGMGSEYVGEEGVAYTRQSSSSKVTEAKAEIARAMANVLSSITSLVSTVMGSAMSSLMAMRQGMQQQQVQQVQVQMQQSGQRSGGAESEVDRVLSDVTREIKTG